MDYTPENITTLESNQIFVFGSNLAGRHGAGAAKFAYDRFGAVYGQGVGLAGQSYALPTLDENLGQLTFRVMDKQVSLFYQCVRANPGLEFLLTKVGCGLGGYAEWYMKMFFDQQVRGNPTNLVKPQGW